MQMKGYIMEALSSTQEDRELAVSLESVKWELMDAEKELKWLKSCASSSQKEYDQIQRKIDQIHTELDTERLYSFNFLLKVGLFDLHRIFGSVEFSLVSLISNVWLSLVENAPIPRL